MSPPCRILIVDDTPTGRRCLVAALHGGGYETLEACSGREALHIAEERKPDLILLDVSMPDLDGFEVCKAFKSRAELAGVPVIFITGKAEASDVERAFAVGCSDYVTKPFHMGEVNARVAVHLQLRKMSLELAESHTQLLRSQKLESIGQLAAGIAHEINTPIQYVSDNTRFLKDSFAQILELLQAYAKLAQEAQEGTVEATTIAALNEAVAQADLDYLLGEIPKSIDQSLDGVGRVSSIVRAMKEFSHPGVEEMTRVDLNRAIESTATVCRNEWKYHADLDLQLDPDLPPVPCLPGEINQVFLNIIVNAAHAIADMVGKDGGNRGLITVSTRTSNGSAEIRIRDTGTGIPEEIRNKIFDPFFTTKQVGKGTGQGLAIAHAVVTQKHGGTISLESEVGVGTMFIIRLPLEQDALLDADQAA